MNGLDLPHIWWMAAGCFVVALVSAVLPWVNAEVLMLAALPFARSPLHLALLVALMTMGQMTGKSAMYWFSRRAALKPTPRVRDAMARWKGRLDRHPRSALGVVLVSSAVGIPPFYMVSIVAGALNIAFGRFLMVGTFGRLVHFAVLALVPQLIGRTL
jgi:membrane protein YqaA with SNARE-associated domain